MRLLHWTLGVAELDASLAFYRDVLGCAHVASSEAGDAHRLEKDGQRFELVRGRDGAGGSRVTPQTNHLGLSHLTVAINNAEATLAQLRHAGVRVREHTRGSFVPGMPDDQFLFEDPDGNLIETFAPAAYDEWNVFGGPSEPATSAPGIAHLSHWSLCVADPEPALRFYQDVLGWQLVAAMDWSGEGPSRVMDVGDAELTTWLLTAGDQRVEVIHFARPPSPPQANDGLGLLHMTVKADDGTDGVLEDPDGNRILVT